MATPRIVDAVSLEGRIQVEAEDGGIISIEFIFFEPGRLLDGDFDRCKISLPPEIARSVPKRREEFFYGRLAAARALADMGFPPAGPNIDGASAPISAPSVGIGMHREPVWPSGIVGSITHCRGLAAATVASNDRVRGIGIDVENVVGSDTQAALLQVVLDAAEIDCLSVASLHYPFELLLTITFSAKESFFKAVFNSVGYMFGFEVIRLQAVDLDRQCLDFVLAATLGAELCAGYSFQIGFKVLSPEIVLTYFAW